MKYMLYIYLYRFLSYFFYYLGDLASRIPTEFAYWVYQIAMRESIKYDDMSGQTIWKEVE
jgi:hypothetical protein